MPDLQNIKRNTNGFSFTETVASLVNNREYRSGYDDLINGKENDKTYFWTALSAVGEEVGSVIYENVLNYINNVANINTCKLRALTSIAKVLGVTEFAILKNLKTVPEDVLKMMDVFSINRAYLLNINSFDSAFVKDLLMSTLDEESLLIAEDTLKELAEEQDESKLSNVFSIFAGISNDKYEEYIEEVFFKLLSSKLFQTYGNVSSDFVYLNLLAQNSLSSTGDLEFTRSSDKGEVLYNRYWTTDPFENSYRNDYPKTVYRYKKAFNVPLGFDQSKIVDDIENGVDFLDNYQGGELSVLQLEIDERSKAKFTKEGGYESDRPDTRYSYYNEQEVRQYVKFIDDMYVLKQSDAASAVSIDDISASFLNWTPYVLRNNVSAYFLDPNYSNVSITSNTDLQDNISTQLSICQNELSDSYLLSNGTFDEFVYNYYGNVFSEEVRSDDKLRILSEGNLVRIVAQILKDICLAIVDIREKLKTQSQRNYMTGTKLLIEYILNEYLINTLINTYGTDPEKTKAQDNNNSIGGLMRQSVGAQIIEFIDTTEYFNIGLLSNETGYVKPGVNVPYYSDLSGNGYTGSITGRGLNPIDIRNFYMASLGISSNHISDENSYCDFMSAVYEVGMSKTYVGKDGALAIDKDLLDDGLSIRLNLEKLSSEKEFTKEDYEFFQKNWYLETSEGYRSINYPLLSDYYDVLSNDLNVISSEFIKYNDALSIRTAQQSELMLKYHGMDIAYYPWYNYKNQDYPTFQAHPYMYNFVEHQNDDYPVENAFYGNANEDLIYELQSENISVYLGDIGNMLRYWRNSSYDYSGYKSRYENSLHTYGSSNSNGLYSVTHYDGLFYPPAIDLYKRYASVDNPLSDTITGKDGQTKTYVGLELLSAHMTKCVDDGMYEANPRLDIPEISSMWHYYSHLNLTKAERYHIAEQLVGLSADIMEIADAEYRVSSSRKQEDAEPYDIYRYALDYNNNSIILLKRYYDGATTLIKNSEATQAKKKNTTGQLWIKYNSHPIAFPAFLKGEKYSYLANVVLDDRKESVEWNHLVIQNANNGHVSDKGTGASIDNIYDFDIAGGGRYLAFAIENPAPSEVIPKKTYKNSVTIASRIFQRKKSSYSDPSSEIRLYMLIKAGPTFLYPNDQGHGSFNTFALSDLTPTDYEFDGYFQNGSILYAGYFKRSANEDNLLTDIALNAIAYPATSEEQSTNIESRSFCFRDTYHIPPLSTQYATTKKDAKIKLGYFSKDNSFTIAVANEILSSKQLYIQDFIGFNSDALTSYDELTEGYGYTDYVAATSGDYDALDVDRRNTDSFDRFDSLISIYDIKESDIYKREASSAPAIYALNSDASYTPLYYGVDGQNLYYKLKNKETGEAASYNKWWHAVDDNISSSYVPRNSMELLGYSFQDIETLIDDKENTIYADEYTGKSTSIDSSNLLKNALRVYEDFLSGGYVLETYNKGFVWEKTSADTQTIDFKIGLSSINSQTSSLFNVLLLNNKNGQDRNPILAGPLSEETISSTYYDSDATFEEEFLISTGYKPDSMVHIVGTPNPFNVKDTTFGLDYTNHIFNISGLQCKLEWNEDDSAFHLLVTLTRKNDSIDFALQTNQLVLFVYKTTLDQFNKYHYLEPFGVFPNNAAISVWNLPWKDKSHAWIYVNEMDELSAMWAENSFANYLDKRVTDPSDISADSYKPGLWLSGVYVNSVVGHLSISAYNPNTGELSISLNDSRLAELSLMENIDLSSLSSFDESYYLSNGQITWKISEEDTFNHLKLAYPPTLIDSLLYDKFYGYNKQHISYNVFDLSNTYIFQLEDPLSIANKIGQIAVPIGTAADEFELVYEDYLSDQVSVDVGGTGFMWYEEMVYAPSSANETKNFTPEEIDQIIQTELTAVNNALAEDSVSTMTSALSIAASYEYYPEESERNNRSGIIDYYLLSADPDEISDHLKVYVNWRKYRNENANSDHEDEIELFFNYPNLFLSPYSYKTKDGSFSVEYKPNTYLRLKSGQDGYLYIVFQFKYYDSMGTLCGIRDLPVLTYHIYNVSDDKPKFIITKTYEIDNRDGKYTYPGDADENIVYLIVNSKKYTHDMKIDSSASTMFVKDGDKIKKVRTGPQLTLDECVGYNYDLNYDLYLNTTLDVFSPIPLKYLDFEMIYERGRMPEALTEDDSELAFEPLLSRPGTYIESKGNISAHFDNKTLHSTLDFTGLMGMKINESTKTRSFPIEILNADGEDIYGNHPKFVFVNGMIELDDNLEDPNGIPTGAYLARELNFTDLSEEDRAAAMNSETSAAVWARYSLSAASENNKHNAGWILEEQQRALIRMYSIGSAGDRKLLAEIENNKDIPLKTTGSRESRFDQYNDLFLLEDTGNDTEE